MNLDNFSFRLSIFIRLENIIFKEIAERYNHSPKVREEI